MAAPLPADLSKVDPVEAWKPWTPSTEEPWDRKRIAHLYRRAAFGATPADIDKAQKAGFPKTLERLISGEPDAADLAELIRVTGEFFDEPANIRTWWLYSMMMGGHPLREKLTLFWHNHFATSYAKIRSSQLMLEQNLTIRKHALGKFRPFLLDMSKDTAMLIWLDSNRNLKNAPNENFAREVMELFSLGVGHYTEKDIQEAARAFSGWHHDQSQTSFKFNADEHDDGQKTVLGQKGNWTGSDVIRICCDQPACARFLVGKLYAYLVSEAPPPRGLLTPLEEKFRKSDYNITELLATIFGSRLFFSQHAYRKRIKWPVEYVLEAFHSVTPGPVPPFDFVAPLAKMGQVLFSPPNVKGWRTGTDWLNSATLLARNNFAETVALGEWSRQKSPRGTKIEPPEVVEQDVQVTPSLVYHEEANLALGGGIANAGLMAAHTVADTPDGMKFLVLDSAQGGGGKQGSSGKSTAPPPPPASAVDPVATIYASKPKDIPALAARMSELLYGERIAAAHIARIEKFLNEPLSAPASGPQPKSDKNPAKPSATSKAGPPPKGEEVKEKEPARKTGAVDMESAEFKARVREALHAMMCLPEYQLN